MVACTDLQADMTYELCVSTPLFVSRLSFQASVTPVAKNSHSG